jgi:hypothetical protein
MKNKGCGCVLGVILMIVGFFMLFTAAYELGHGG